MDYTVNTPVVLFIFKRKETLLRIIDRVRIVKPRIIYLIGDEGRDEQEKTLVRECRAAVESAIDWECKVVKNYANENRGVYRNIGEGAKWVFSIEKTAIFLEDDNLPELSFFKYCEDLLQLYQQNTKVLWICGTNYLEKYESESDTSYMFTQHLLPCGWASWSDKFIRFYDGQLQHLTNNDKLRTFKNSYSNKALWKQQLYSIKQTKYLQEKNINKSSWDYQMVWSLRSNGLYGISPRFNQIKNIGVDQFSEHGGNSMDLEMTNRFCRMDSISLSFPLIHPNDITIDPKYESLVGDIILNPISDRLKRTVASIVKPMIGLKPHDSMAEFLRSKKR